MQQPIKVEKYQCINCILVTTCSFQIWLLSFYYEYVNAVYPTVLIVDITFVIAYIEWKYVFSVGMEITYIWLYHVYIQIRTFS